MLGQNINTDAEGRLILCDALFEAAQESPDLLIDAATLTGAARTGLGDFLPALFSSDRTIASDILAAGIKEVTCASHDMQAQKGRHICPYELFL